MRTNLMGAYAFSLAITLAGTASAEENSPKPLMNRPFTALLGFEASVVGLSFGPRAELLYRLGPPGTVSHARTTIGVLIGPEFVFVPIGIGYRALFRQAKTVQPFVGLGYEAHFFFTEGPVFAQWAAMYLEGGTGFAINDQVTVGGALSLDWTLVGERGPGLQARLFGGYNFF